MQVTDKKSNDVMVLKELLNYDEEAKTNFLKEVSFEIFSILLNKHFGKLLETELEQ